MSNALVFPGQGAQYAGMGKANAERFASAPESSGQTILRSSGGMPPRTIFFNFPDLRSDASAAPTSDACATAATAATSAHALRWRGKMIEVCAVELVRLRAIKSSSSSRKPQRSSGGGVVMCPCAQLPA